MVQKSADNVLNPIYNIGKMVHEMRSVQQTLLTRHVINWSCSSVNTRTEGAGIIGNLKDMELDVFEKVVRV